ncbi:NADH dehydrogenase [ubiquinone] iron-sulfur protein 6, mitochondrial [Frankliniella fusca]|uniref:NADH dehydrogenase [ubiquinone] iron-sulfur protein 6, mitochondrial n=1 Tax=Frankliniella fusca TaxID=407009 RepID=A0AAE1LIU2_9NEOP|nr:NADH dehydrogenase [ubiquinone] iron-sulfur protein 6, mitochondrial [Frankliniella fusca]
MAANRGFVALGQSWKLSRSFGDVSGVSKTLVRCASSNLPSDRVTHTGQKWEEDDYRMARFVNKTKLVNENWAAKLIESVPPETRKERVVSCDGGGGPTGHPKVYINLDKPGNHSCLYCGLRFKKDGSHH